MYSIRKSQTVRKVLLKQQDLTKCMIESYNGTEGEVMNSKVSAHHFPVARVVLTRRCTISSVGFALDNICPRFDLKKVNSKLVFLTSLTCYCVWKDGFAAKYLSYEPENLRVLNDTAAAFYPPLLFSLCSMWSNAFKIDMCTHTV